MGPRRYVYVYTLPGNILSLAEEEKSGGLRKISDDKEDKEGVEPSPCFSNFLARTTFVLESLLEAKNPGQDAFFGGFCL